MPCLTIFTNVPKSKIPAGFLKRAIPMLVECVKKAPEKFICVLSPDCLMSIVGDTTTPAVLASLESIGNMGLNENKYISEKITAFLAAELGVPARRVFITFYDLKSENVGIGGTTTRFTVEIPMVIN